MNEIKRLAILSGVALVLVVTILVFVCINPWVAVGLPAVLFAIAAIIRAIGGPDDTKAGDSPAATTNPGV